MKKSIWQLIAILVFPVCLLFQFCHEEQQVPVVPSDLEIDKFLIIPAEPSSKDQVNMVTRDCKYNILAYVKVRGKEIEVKKRFNSQMKWPCILRNDTIPLGKLTQGNYQVTFLLVDTNPMVKDSIASEETITLKVKK